MPKMKTRRATRKRMRVLPSGKVKRWKAMHSHLLQHKSPQRRRRLRKGAIVTAANAKRVRRMLPNG